MVPTILLNKLVMYPFEIYMATLHLIELQVDAIEISTRERYEPENYLEKLFTSIYFIQQQNKDIRIP